MSNISNEKNREFSIDLLEFALQKIKNAIDSQGPVSRVNFIIPTCIEAANQVAHWDLKNLEPIKPHEMDLALVEVKGQIQKLMMDAMVKKEMKDPYGHSKSVVLNDWISLQILPAESDGRDAPLTVRAVYCSASPWMLSNLLCSAAKLEQMLAQAPESEPA